MYYGLITQWFSTTVHKHDDFEGWTAKGLEKNIFRNIRALGQLVLAPLLSWASPDYAVRERFKWWMAPQTRPCKTKPTCCTCTVVRVYKHVKYCFYQNTNGTVMQKAVLYHAGSSSSMNSRSCTFSYAWKPITIRVQFCKLLPKLIFTAIRF